MGDFLKSGLSLRWHDRAIRFSAIFTSLALTALLLVLPGAPAQAGEALPPVQFPNGVTIDTDYALGTLPAAVVGATVPSDAKLEYQWYMNGQAVQGATGRILRAAIGGSVLTVRVTGTASGYTPTAVTSQPIGPMPRQLDVSYMSLRGEAVVGRQLHPWWPQAPIVTPSGGTPIYTYVWKRDDVAIPGANNAIYTVTTADRGHTLKVELNIKYEPLTQKTVSAHVMVPLTPRGDGFNADRTADIFARTPSGDLLLYPGNGKRGFLGTQTIGRGWDIFDVLLAPGDFDGDGPTDVIGRDRAGRLFLYRGNGAGGWKDSRQIGQGWQIFSEIVAPGDFNVDGTNDLLAKDTSGRLILYPGDGAGGWHPPVTVGWGWNMYSKLITPGWWSGDFRPNILAQTPAGELKVYSSFSEGFVNHPVITAGTGWNTVLTAGGPGDFNSDGSPDVFGINAAGDMTMYLGNGTDVATCGFGCFLWKGYDNVGWGWGGFTAVF